MPQLEPRVSTGYRSVNVNDPPSLAGEPVIREAVTQYITDANSGDQQGQQQQQQPHRQPDPPHHPPNHVTPPAGLVA